MNFVSKISVGVKELVREPAEGLKEGKGEMIVGVGRGVQSFFGGVLGGITGSVSTILNSFIFVLLFNGFGYDDERLMFKIEIAIFNDVPTWGNLCEVYVR